MTMRFHEEDLLPLYLYIVSIGFLLAGGDFWWMFFAAAVIFTPRWGSYED